MKRLLLIFLVAIGSAVSAQENVELPDFIITGRQSVDVPSVQKAKPELISILSKDFFTPQYSSEELPLLISSQPVPIIPSILTLSDPYNGSLKVSLGKYTLPVGELNMALNNQNYLMNLKLWGVNIDEYIPFAGYNNSGVKLSNDFFISTRSDFLPGTKFSIDASYWRDSYRFYGSATPDEQRLSNNGIVKVSLENSYSRIMNFALNAEGNLLQLNQNDFRETNLIANGLFELRWNKLIFGASGTFQLQNLSNNLSGVGSYDNLSVNGYLLAPLFSYIWFKAGLYLNTNDVKTFYSPFASVEFLIDKGLSIGAEYNPKVEFLTTRDFLDRNLYFNQTLVDNSFTEYFNNITGQFRYEYQKVFSAALSLNYAKADNFIYFQDITAAGKYDVVSTNDVSRLKSKFNIYYKGIVGSFFGEAVYQSVTDGADRIIPNIPQFSTAISYKYDFDFGLGIGFGYSNAVNIYTDIASTEKLVDYHNLSAALEYEILKALKVKFDFQNILNRSNFTLKQYQAKPFDYLMGIEYSW